MTVLAAPQEEKVTVTSPWQGKLPVDHEIPPQHQHTSTGLEDAKFLVPPQEEKVDTSAPGKAPLDKSIDRLEKEINSHAIREDAETRDDQIRNRQIRGSVLAGAAGVTGEDLGVAEDQRIV